MPYVVEQESGEEVIDHLTFSVGGNTPPFNLAISNMAIYLPRSKRFAVKDPTYFERVPIRRVLGLEIRRLRPYFLWALSLVMIVVGGVTTCFMLVPLVKSEKTTVSGLPPAIVIVGVLIPFLARRRFGLSVQMVESQFKWAPPLVIDRASKDAIELLWERIAIASKKAGISVIDERIFGPGPGTASKPSYPLALRADDTNTKGGVIRPCYHCGNPLKVSRWDDWNGFLYECPYCAQVHGKPWRPYVVIFASFMFNAISYLFTMRPKHAAMMFAVTIILYLGFDYSLNHEGLSDALELGLSGAFFLTPLFVNGAILIRHQMALGSARLSKKL